MPNSRTGAGARSRRPARRGARGGCRVRRARKRGSGDQLTAPGVGVPDGLLRVGRLPTSARPVPPAGAAAPRLGAEPGDGTGRSRPVPHYLSRPPRLTLRETRHVSSSSVPEAHPNSEIILVHTNVRSLVPNINIVPLTLQKYDVDMIYSMMWSI